jgi:peptidyl-prolyl cis-trans isomerase SurA
MKVVSTSVLAGILALVLAIVPSAVALHAQKPGKKLVDKVVGVVGDKIVMLSDIMETRRMLANQNDGAPLPADVECVIFQQLLTDKLLLVQAERDSLEVTDEEVEAQLNQRIGQIINWMGGEAQFVQYYGFSPLEMKEKMRGDMKDQMLQERMQEQVLGKVTVTPTEVREYFSQIPKDSLPYFNTEVEISHIMVRPKPSQEQDRLAREKAEEIRKQLLGGGDFCDLARRFSSDGSKTNCGDLGWADRGAFVQEFEAAAYRLKPNEFSAVVKSPFGYHIIQLIERLGNKIHARHILVPVEVTYADEQAALARLDSARNAVLRGEISFTDAVKRYSDDEYTRENGGRVSNQKTGEASFQLSELDPDAYFATDTLQVGGLTAPFEVSDFDGKKAFRLIRLNQRTEPHQANLETDYSRIQAAALSQKKNKALRKWVEERIAKFYVEIANEYQGCAALKKWLGKP